MTFCLEFIKTEKCLLPANVNKVKKSTQNYINEKHNVIYRKYEVLPHLKRKKKYK